MRWNRAVRAAVALLAGCVGPTMHDPHAGQYKLSFHNEAGGPVCVLYIYPFGQQQPSNNFLDADTEVASGDGVDFWLPPNTYQINAQGCPYEKQQVGGYAPQVIMNMDGVAVLYREDDAKRKDTAQAYVHDSHNGTLIPAKLTFIANPAKKPGTVHPARTKSRADATKRDAAPNSDDDNPLVPKR